ALITSFRVIRARSRPNALLNNWVTKMNSAKIGGMPQPPRGLPNTFYFSLVTVDPEAAHPLYRQIYQGIRAGIEDGRLPPHTKLPSTRDLAQIWDVSRNTLRNAFDQLIAEGYLEAIVGHGTFVVEQPVQSGTAVPPPPTARKRPISQIGQALESLGTSIRQPQPPLVGFAVGSPGYDIFPYKLWNRVVNRCQRRNDHFLGSVNGLPRLREAIASYLTSARGLHCAPEQIDIVPGSVMGMYIASLAFINPGDKVWLEEPGYINVSGIMQYRSAEIVPVPVDAEGMDVQQGIQQAPEARLAYVTPSHQYPLGVTMSLSRRQQLLSWAAQQGAWILEDDYDSEFRYDGPPITALQGLDSHQRVIYCGTFSKVMLPTLRLGYIVLPPDLIDVYTGVKLPLSIHCPSLAQEAMAEFMLEGHFVRHIRQMRREYQARRDALVTAVSHHLAGAVTLGDVACGMHAVAYLADELDEDEIVQKAHAAGMAVLPLARDYFGQPRQKGLVLGFTDLPPEAIETQIAKLATTIHL
ncbi:MAG: PLP-dependent aminotransferase family protein, partial [Anaerolineales bacterium]|nr:PLP-dependent aminotransferase family protein [Anaerolineales bacterium]